MAIKVKNFIKRFLIFQFIFLFTLSKVFNMQNNFRDFSKRIKFFGKYFQLSENKIEFIDNNSSTIFIILFINYFLAGGLAILDFNFGKGISGLLTILISIVYCNPIITIKKNIEKYPNETKLWKIILPNLEFCLISSLGIIMILSSNVSDKIENNENENNFSNTEKQKLD